MKLLFVKKMHCLIFPWFSQLSFSGASKILSCGNVPDGGWKFKAEQEHCMRVPTHDCSGAW